VKKLKAHSIKRSDYTSLRSEGGGCKTGKKGQGQDPQGKWLINKQERGHFTRRGGGDFEE